MKIATVQIDRDPQTRVFRKPYFISQSDDIYEDETRKPLPEVGTYQYDPDKRTEVEAAAELITAMQDSLSHKITAMQLDIQRLEQLRNNLCDYGID